MAILVALMLASTVVRAGERIDLRELGAVGDGKTDCTAVFALAFDLARKAGGGEIVIPAGTFLISETMELSSGSVRGLHLRGAGGGGLGSSFWNKTAHYATNLVWSGADGGTMFRFIGVSPVVDGMNLYGRNRADKAQQGRANILIHLMSAKGHGSMLHRFSNLLLADAGVGVHFGEEEGDITCSDTKFDHIMLRELDSGIRVVNNQGVDYLFNFIFALKCGVILDFVRGGNVLVNNAQLTDCDVFCNIEGGGRNVGTYVFNMVRVEGVTSGEQSRHQLLRSHPKWGQAIVKFTGYDDCQWYWNSNPELKAANVPLCDIGAGTMVVFDSSIFNSPLAAMAGGDKGDARLIVRNSSFSYVMPEQTVVAENERSFYKFMDCTDVNIRALPDHIRWEHDPE